MPVTGIDYSDTLAAAQAANNNSNRGKDASQLTMDDFMTLLIAQMTMQDMFNPTSDTEFIAQMAQFATLSGVQALQDYTVSSYATSYVGKYVTITSYEKGGVVTVKGLVERVNFFNGEPMVVVDGKSYPLYTVMEVSNTEIPDDPDPDPDPDPDVGDGG